MSQNSRPETSTSSFLLEIDEVTRAGLRAVGDLRAELQEAFYQEKKERKLTQQEVARLLKVNRSVVHRQLTGEENLTVRKAAELAKAMGWLAKFNLTKPHVDPGQNETSATPVLGSNSGTQFGTGVRSQPKVVMPYSSVVAVIPTSGNIVGAM